MATINSNNILQLVEGVLFENKIIPLTNKTKKELYDEVVSAILTNWSNNSNIRSLAIRVGKWNSDYQKVMSGKSTTVTADSLYKRWEEINNLIMKNSNIAIIATARNNNNLNGIKSLGRTGAYAASEGDVLKKGITKASEVTVKNNSGSVRTTQEFRTGVSSDILNGNIPNVQIQQFNFGKHYENLEKTMTTKVPDINELKAARDYITSTQNKNKNSKLRARRYWKGASTGNVVFNNLVYGYHKGDDIGRIVEVFFNHLVMYHHNQIEVKGGVLDIKNRTGTVREEEYPNLLDHMYQWNDNDPLTSGGDIIVIDTDNDIMFNIQLKSTSKALRELPNTIGNYVNITAVYNKYMKYVPQVLEAINQGTNTVTIKGRKRDIIPKNFVYNLITSVWTNPK